MTLYKTLTQSLSAPHYPYSADITTQHFMHLVAYMLLPALRSPTQFIKIFMDQAMLTPEVLALRAVPWRCLWKVDMVERLHGAEKAAHSRASWQEESMPAAEEHCCCSHGEQKTSERLRHRGREGLYVAFAKVSPVQYNRKYCVINWEASDLSYSDFRMFCDGVEVY